MAQNIVPFDSMKMFIELCPDSFGVADLLHVLSQCSELQVQLRRSEKKVLNEMHKNSKYRIKTDLAPSKFRVNVPSHKAFIMLQASISGHTCENYTMQAEMYRMVDYATRMLSAIQDYSVGSTLHGNIALESLLLKRSFDNSLWKGTDGMLNQLPGVGVKTTAKLIKQGIVSFGDVLEANLETLEKAAGRKSPFGDELKLAAARILSDSLSVRAEVNDVSGEVMCHVTNFDLGENVSSKEGRSYFEKIKRKDVAVSKVKKSSYILAVFTDHPGGLLMWRTDLKEAGVHSVKLPKKWGKITVRLVSSFMGLDVQSEVDGGGSPFVTKLERDKKKGRGLANIFSPNKRMKVGAIKNDKGRAQAEGGNEEDGVVDANTDGVFDLDEIVPTGSVVVAASSATTKATTAAFKQAEPLSPSNYSMSTTVDERAEAFAAYDGKKQKRRPFSNEEEACISAGVERYGEGHWANIRDDYREVLVGRSCIDVEDKWRNMNNRVPPANIRNPYRNPQTSIDSFTTKKSHDDTVGWQSRTQMFESSLSSPSFRMGRGGGYAIPQSAMADCQADPAMMTTAKLNSVTPYANDVVTPSYRVGGQSKLRVTPVKSNDYVAQFEFDPNKAESFLDATLSGRQGDSGEEDRRLAYENAMFDETKRALSWGASRSSGASVTSSSGGGAAR